MAGPLFERLSQWIGLNDYPLLHLLLNERRFRWAAGTCFFILVGVPLSAVKVIRVTPPDLTPEVKISALDWFQSKSLARKARHLPIEAEASNQLTTWRLAIGDWQ